MLPINLFGKETGLLLFLRRILRTKEFSKFEITIGSQRRCQDRISEYEVLGPAEHRKQVDVRQSDVKLRQSQSSYQ